MLKNIIFDCGGVLIDFRPDNLILDLPSESADFKLLHSSFFWDWASLDAGTISYGDYIGHTLNLLPDRLHEASLRMFKDWYKQAPYIEGMKEVITTLKKQGYKVYMLSNAPVYFYEHLDFFWFKELFDGIVISACLKMAKPEKRIYEYTTANFNLKPEECFFVDDRLENIQSCQECGWKGLVFNGDYRTVIPAIEACNPHE